MVAARIEFLFGFGDKELDVLGWFLGWFGEGIEVAGDLIDTKIAVGDDDVEFFFKHLVFFDETSDETAVFDDLLFEFLGRGLFKAIIKEL